MGDTIESRVLGGSAASAVSFAMYFAQNVLLVPLLLHYWGPDRYGSWLSLFALYALLQSIDIGHQSYMGNEFCK